MNLIFCARELVSLEEFCLVYTASLVELVRRWQKYSARYGTIHAAARFIGARVPPLWRFLGPVVSRAYRVAWIAGAGPKILNLGGGSNCLDGCLTVDIDPRSDCYVDVSKRLPFSDSSIDGIFCEEVIEHVSKADGACMLRECFRILKIGGMLRITTPDLNWFCASLLSRSIDCSEVNGIFYNHSHQHIYSREDLQELLSNCGFVDIRHTAYRDADSRYGHLDSHPMRFGHEPAMSQYIEARRGGG